MSRSGCIESLRILRCPISLRFLRLRCLPRVVHTLSTAVALGYCRSQGV